MTSRSATDLRTWDTSLGGLRSISCLASTRSRSRRPYRASKGLYTLEALAAGIPVVHPRIGVFPELLESTGGGYLCEPANSLDLATKLERLLLDRDAAQRLGAEARRTVREGFHSGRMASETMAVYQRILG